MSKKKKKKVIYYDDGSTVSDMTGVKGVHNPVIGGGTPSKKKSAPPPKPQSTAKDKFKTYWSAVKMMFIPMCVVILILSLIFLFLLLIPYCAG